MSSINLAQSNPGGGDQGLHTIFDKSLVISLGLITVSLGTFFGLMAYNSFLKKEMVSADSSISASLAELEGESVNRVVDFQDRMTNIDAQLTSTDIAPQEMFASIEKLMVGGASLGSYKYDIKEKTLSMKIISGDFKTVAQQIINFKSSNSFKNVTVSNTSKGSDGTVTSDVVISL